MIDWSCYDAEKSWQSALDGANDSYQLIPKGSIDYDLWRGQFRLTEMLLQLAQVHATNAQTAELRKLCGLVKKLTVDE